MKKNTIYSIIAVLLLVIVTAGSTYAYLSSTVTTPNNSILSSTRSLNIIYSGGTTINNSMSVASNKNGGYNTTVSIRLAPNSAIARSDLYIYINEITQNIAIEGFIWEVYGYKNGVQVYSNQGNFDGYNSTTNNKVLIVDNYLLSEDETTFTVYFWIDGSQTNNDVLGGSFSGYIGATSEEFTAQLQ